MNSQKAESAVLNLLNKNIPFKVSREYFFNIVYRYYNIECRYCQGINFYEQLRRGGMTPPAGGGTPPLHTERFFELRTQNDIIQQYEKTTHPVSTSNIT